MMNTILQFMLLVDYEEYYGQPGSIDQTREFNREIPTIVLIQYMASFNVKGYLHENSEKIAVNQAMLTHQLLGIAGQKSIDYYLRSVKRIATNGLRPVFISHSPSGLQ
jgi:hypothetical protein